jgi:hypothetical protein
MRTVTDCPHEVDVLDAVAAQRWPDRVDADLREHVVECSCCAELGQIAAAFLADRDTAWSDARALPSADVIWFRAQARARADAAREAARPIAIMQALGFACAAAVISALIGVVAVWVWSRADSLFTFRGLELIPLDAMGFAIRGTLLAIGLWLVLAPVAVYLVASDD